MGAILIRHASPPDAALASLNVDTAASPPPKG